MDERRPAHCDHFCRFFAKALVLERQMALQAPVVPVPPRFEQVGSWKMIFLNSKFIPENEWLEFR